MLNTWRVIHFDKDTHEIVAIDTMNLNDKFSFSDFIEERELHRKIYWGKDDNGIYFILSKSIDPKKESVS